MDAPPGYINVEVLPEHIGKARQMIQENVEKLYAPVEVYRQYLGEFCQEHTYGCIKIYFSDDIIGCTACNTFACLYILT